jgi:uncharacterized protein YgbK (DUF1537 family)
MSLLYAWYGDDFTGSTDVLESLAEGGVSAVLFLRPPSDADRARFADVRSVGLAGDARSRSPDWMSAHLPDLFQSLQAFDAPITHYKTCSTFDSAPHVGSIGRAMEIGAELFGGFVPIVVGAPHLRRYVAFGTLFATAGDQVYRIDRHPTMSRHPVTPMHEADLRLHLKAQTAMEIGLVTLDDLLTGQGAAALAAQMNGRKAVLFDGTDARTQAIAGDLLWACAGREVRFAVGSSGVTRALTDAWNSAGLATAPTTLPRATEVSPLLVVSGSCSPMTARQIDWARDHGYHGIAVDMKALDAEPERLPAEALPALKAGKNVIIYSAQGPLDANAEATGADLGQALGRATKRLVAEANLKRVLFCGGDTSSHAVQQLELTALSYAAPLERGAPLCRAHADSLAFDGLELVLKGGQMGGEDFFEVVRHGSAFQKV